MSRNAAQPGVAADELLAVARTSQLNASIVRPTGKRPMHVILVVVLVALLADVGWTQDSPLSDPRLHVLSSVEPRATLRIAFTDSVGVEGKFLGAEPGIVRLQIGERDSSFNIAHVSTIREKGRFTWAGGLLGATVGAIVVGGIAAAIASFPVYCESDCDQHLKPALRAAPIGAIIGLAVAFVVQDSKWHQRFP